MLHFPRHWRNSWGKDALLALEWSQGLVQIWWSEFRLFLGSSTSSVTSFWAATGFFRKMDSTKDELGFQAIQADGGCLVKLGRLFFLIFLKKKGIQIIFQQRMEAVGLYGRIFRIVMNTAVYKWVAHVIPDIMTEEACHVGDTLFSLLTGGNGCQAV